VALALPTSTQAAALTCSGTLTTTPTVLEPAADSRFRVIDCYSTASTVEWAVYTLGETPQYAPLPASVWTSAYSRPEGVGVGLTRLALRTTSGTATVYMVVR
jgi:hypothetical protein